MPHTQYISGEHKASYLLAGHVLSLFSATDISCSYSHVSSSLHRSLNVPKRSSLSNFGSLTLRSEFSRIRESKCVSLWSGTNAVTPKCRTPGAPVKPCLQWLLQPNLTKEVLALCSRNISRLFEKADEMAWAGTVNRTKSTLNAILSQTLPHQTSFWVQK